jgi:hypothetical protein
MPHESTVNPDDPIEHLPNVDYLINRAPKHESITAKNSLIVAKADALKNLSSAIALEENEIQ